MANVKDGATSTVLTAPSPATSGTSLVVQSGDGTKFPSPPFYAIVHPVNSIPTVSNAEKVLVTAVSTDTFTIVRAQGIYTAKSIAVGWRISNAIFQEDMNNSSIIQNEVPGGSINGSNTAFTLASATGMVTGSLKLFKNGVRMKGGGADYTETSTGFTMVTAPATGTVLLADYNVNGALNNVGTNSLISDEVPTGSVNGSNTAFTTARAYIAGTLEVFINGVKQARTTHFTETTPGSGIFTMSDAPLASDNIMVNYSYNLNPSGNADTVDGFHAWDLMPVGAVLPYAGINAPSGNWLLAYGQAVSRTTYADLFAALSTTYGVGDGSTTFNIPDLRGRVIAGKDDMGGTSANRLTNPGSTGGMDGDILGNTGGSETHTQTTGELAGHNHAVDPKTVIAQQASSGYNAGFGAGGAAYSKVGIYADTSPAYGTNTGTTGSSTPFNIVQPTIILNYIIKAL